jgi:hypothetical protein
LEGVSGQYSANVASFHPTVGYVQMNVSITCPTPAIAEDHSFDIYVDPSGMIKDGSGLPVAGATMTLYAYDAVSMSLIPVPEGDARLSPANRLNPDQTDSAGHFGWDVSAGTYAIRAEKDGCVSPANPELAYVQTNLLQAPFDIVDLELRLNCAGDSWRTFIPALYLQAP